MTKLSFKNSESVSAIAFDSENQELYWSNDLTHEIRLSRLRGVKLSKEETVLKSISDVNDMDFRESRLSNVSRRLYVASSSVVTILKFNDLSDVESVCQICDPVFQEILVIRVHPVSGRMFVSVSGSHGGESCLSNCIQEDPGDILHLGSRALSSFYLHTKNGLVYMALQYDIITFAINDRLKVNPTSTFMHLDTLANAMDGLDGLIFWAGGARYGIFDLNEETRRELEYVDESGEDMQLYIKKILIV